ncbi:MAG: mannitol dehydrogenase family protein [Akkermansiaceae bacterium]|nr:mannitol dehydrogenase family protein [Akkermansiaceae bacterium]
MKQELKRQGKAKIPEAPVPYDRTKIQPGIVHIGVGNFHRAHEEFYTNQLLGMGSREEWGISGVALLPQDEPLYKALKSQDGLYTLTVCGRDGRDEFYEIGSLVDLAWGPENPESVIDRIADPRIKIITLTITEGGYNIDKETGKFMLGSEDVKHDLEHPGHPRTVFGFLAAGLRKRQKNGAGPVTVLSCDNLQHNGDTARKAFTSFIEAQDPELARWVEKNVTFPNSMVDRITPAVTPDDVKRLNAQSGVEDAAPVYSEDFIQWVIEDDFIAGRPDWEAAGAEFTDDVSAYENMKLSLLNASHSLLSYPAFLAGYRRVDEAVGDERFARYLRLFMDRDAGPYVPAPGNTDLELYKKTLLERFGNKAVSDQISRLCFDGVSKIPVYVMPVLTKMIRDDADLERLAFFIAAYRHYLKHGKDDLGRDYEVNEPWLTEEDRKLIASGDPVDFLGLSPFRSTDLKAADKFVSQYRSMVERIEEDGVLPVLEKMILP